MSLPVITIAGNVVTEPTLAITQNGAARLTFRIAANDRKKNQTTGEWEDGDSTFIGVTVWRNLAENAAESIVKGTPVVVIGKLRSRTVEDSERGKATYYDVDAETVAVDLRRGPVAVSKSARPAEVDPWATTAARLSDEPPF